MAHTIDVELIFHAIVLVSVVVIVLIPQCEVLRSVLQWFGRLCV